VVHTKSADNAISCRCRCCWSKRAHCRWARVWAGVFQWEWNWKTVGWQENWEAGNAQRKNQMTNDILLRHPEGHAHVEEWAWTWSLGLCATHPPEHPPIALLGQKLILYANSKLKNS